MHYVGPWVMNYLLPLLIGFVFLGIILMLLDRYFGVHIYRYWYNRGNDPAHHMPTDKEMGFFYHQSPRRQHNRAMFVSATQSLLTIAFAHFSFVEMVAECFALVLEAWFLLPGLWLGNKLYYILKRQDQIIDTISQPEEAVKSIGTWVRGVVSGARDSLSGLKTPSGPNPTPSTPPKPARSAAEILQRKTDGRSV